MLKLNMDVKKLKTGLNHNLNTSYVKVKQVIDSDMLGGVLEFKYILC